MSLSTVQAALSAAAAAGLGAIPTEWPNAPFEKPANAKWAQVFFLPNQPSVETLGAAGEDLIDGIVQVNLNYPRDTGDADARSDFEAFRAQFPAGARKTNTGQTVTITNCGRSQGRLVDQWYRVSYTLAWYALIPR